MAEGVRIQPHARLGWPDGALVVVVDHARPIPPPTNGDPIEKWTPVCSLCGVKHFAKAYHIQLRAGSAIVSATVWERLQRIADNPFAAVNPVAEPPGQIIRPGSNKSVQLVEKYAMPIITPNGHTATNPSN